MKMKMDNKKNLRTLDKLIKRNFKLYHRYCLTFRKIWNKRFRHDLDNNIVKDVMKNYTKLDLKIYIDLMRTHKVIYQSLSKHIAKPYALKNIWMGDYEAKGKCCPSCGQLLSYGYPPSYDYCPYCCQRIEWNRSK